MPAVYAVHSAAARWFKRTRLALRAIDCQPQSGPGFWNRMRCAAVRAAIFQQRRHRKPRGFRTLRPPAPGSKASRLRAPSSADRPQALPRTLRTSDIPESDAARGQRAARRPSACCARIRGIPSACSPGCTAAAGVDRASPPPAPASPLPHHRRRPMTTRQCLRTVAPAL